MPPFLYSSRALRIFSKRICHVLEADSIATLVLQLVDDSASHPAPCQILPRVAGGRGGLAGTEKAPGRGRDSTRQILTTIALLVVAACRAIDRALGRRCMAL